VHGHGARLRTDDGAPGLDDHRGGRFRQDDFDLGQNVPSGGTVSVVATQMPFMLMSKVLLDQIVRVPGSDRGIRLEWNPDEFALFFRLLAHGPPLRTRCYSLSQRRH